MNSYILNELYVFVSIGKIFLEEVSDKYLKNQ